VGLFLQQLPLQQGQDPQGQQGTYVCVWVMGGDSLSGSPPPLSLPPPLLQSLMSYSPTGARRGAA
jgi:hypothetical protein